MAVLATYGSANQDSIAIVGDSSDTENVWGQGFKVANASVIESVELYMQDGATPPTDPITVRLETDSAGLPSGTLIHAGATGTIAAATVPASYAFLPVTFSPGIEVSGATQYHKVASVPAQATDVNFSWGRDTNDGSYADGTASVNVDGGGWSAVAADDLIFIVNGYEGSLPISGMFLNDII